MDPSLRERFACLGPIRGIGRVSSGSPAVFVLRLPPGQPIPRTMGATLALARRGLGMLPAKRAIEALVREGRGLTFGIGKPLFLQRCFSVPSLTLCGTSLWPFWEASQ